MQERQMETLIEFLEDEQGVTSIEYALIAALIAVVIIVAVSLVGNELSGTYNDVASKVADAGGS
jgi:pilus assembly protein Flp/PilA